MTTQRLIGPPLKPYKEGSQQLHMPPTNPGHTKATLYLTPPPSSQDIVGVPVAEIEIVAPNTVQLTIPENFTVVTNDGRGKGTEKLNNLDKAREPTAAPLQLWYRCPSCKRRTLANTMALTDSTLCGNCGRDLRIVHWTGRVGDGNNTSIIDITPEFATAWLKANGWIQRRINLWAKVENKIVNYVDFTKKPFKPTMYAYYEEGDGSPDKRTNAIKQVYTDLLPYFERLTAKEIAIKKSNADRIYKTRSTKLPEEAAPEELLNLTKLTDVIHLVDRCPECRSDDLRTVENTAGKATSCNKCNHTVFPADEEEENEEKTETRATDPEFF